MDLISREEAIEAIKKLSKLYPYKVSGDRESYSKYNEAWCDCSEMAECAILNCESVPQWIPVSERLPDFGVDVLVCNDEGAQVTAKRTAWSTDPNCWAINYCGYDYDSWDFMANGDIVAWMELPKPYERGQKNELR